MVIYGYICYFNKFDRTWELSLFSCCLNSITFSLFVSFKTYNFEQINKIILLFLKNIMLCKTKCALIIFLIITIWFYFRQNFYLHIYLLQNNRFQMN